MSKRDLSTWLTIVFTTLVTASAALGQPDPPKPGDKAEPAAKARVDAEGVRLPDGAIARIGSGRFRFAGGGGPLVFSPDGKLLAIAREGVLLFDVATSRLLHDLRLPDGHSPHAVRFLADGKRIAVGSVKAGGPKLVFFAVADGKPVWSPDLSGQRATHVLDVTPDGSRALLGINLVKAYMWDLRAGRELWSCEHEGGTSIRPLSPDGKLFVRTIYPQTELRDADTAKVVAKFPNAGPQFFDRHRTSLSDDGRIAIPGRSGDAAVAVLTARPAAGVRTLSGELEPDRCAFSPDTRYLVGASRLGTQVWDLAAAENRGLVARLPAADSAGFSPDGKVLALAGDGFVVLCSVGDWKILPQSADPPSPVYRVRVTDDGKRVLAYTTQGWVTWPAGGGPGGRPFADGVQGTRALAAAGLAAVSADGQVAVEVVHNPGKGKARPTSALRVTNLSTGKERSIPLDGQPQTPLYLSPDGRHVALPVTSEAHVWDTHTGELLFRRPRVAGEHFPKGFLPAPDGRSLAGSVIPTSSGDESGKGPYYTAVTVTDHATGRTSRLNPVPWSILTGPRFSRDGTRIYFRGRFDANTGKDSVSVWDARTGRRLASWTGEHGLPDGMGLSSIEGMGLSADNRSLLAGDSSGRLAVVEVATGGERARFQHGGRVLSADFFPDGTKAVSSSPDGPVYIWDLLGEPGKWDAGKADAVWADLASPDAKTAFAAIRRLRANPAEAVAFLKDRVQPVVAPADATVTRLIRGLDGPRFADREKAQKELAAIADLVRPRLEMARKFATEEAARRLDQVLKAADERAPETVRQIRACEVLEGVGTPDAVRLLRHGPTGRRGRPSRPRPRSRWPG
ncbi:MAG TPA: WD40 repeat domain-containing protein [Gemmataceae bacterium]|nr:WD40 repeat domain-containing protein [Gemmataceae bacterium]